MLAYQAILLAGGSENELYPLTSAALPKALLPVGNKALISYSLRMLERGGVKDIVVVCEGEATASHVNNWLQEHHDGNITVEVVSVKEGTASAEAVGHVAARLQKDIIVVTSIDLVSNLSLQDVVATHFVNRAVATMVLSKRKTLASTETKPGKPPKGVDYVGVDTSRNQVLYFCPSPDARRDIRIPLTLITAATNLSITTSLVDAQLYVFQRQHLLNALESNPQFATIQHDLLPYLLKHQVRLPEDKLAPSRTSSTTLVNAGPIRRSFTADFDGLNHAPPSGLGSKCGVPGVNGWFVGLFTPPDGTYCARASSLQAYGEINREVASPDLAISVLGEPAESWLHPSVSTGNKTTLATGCLVGRGTSFGDKCSAKRSVIGSGCRFGNNVKIINSVLLDNVEVADGCHIQNCIICDSCQLHPACSLKDCQIGTGYTVAEGSEYKGEVLARPRAQ